MTHSSAPIPPDTGSKAITILRVFLWLIPAIILPFGIIAPAVGFTVLYGICVVTDLGF